MDSKIKLEIASISSPDIDFSGDVIRPDSVFVLIQMNIGPRGEDATDVFQVLVATPSGLQNSKGRDGILICDRSLIVITDWDWKEIKRILNRIVNDCASSDWITSVTKLQRYFSWEYDDYQLESGQ